MVKLAALSMIQAAATTSVPYWHVDAFATRMFAGNQAAVMVLDGWLDDGLMQAIAAENMFAETAFLVPTPEAATDYALRWFAPSMEVALCGHATLAAGHAMLGREGAGDVVTFQTRRAGVLEVRRAEHGYDLGLPAIAVESEAPDGMADGLGAEPEELLYDARGYLIARFDCEAQVRSLTPDMAALAAHGDTMFIATAPGNKSDVVSRVFVPGAGIPEDSVTGSAHAALTPFWAERLGRANFTAHQASQRGGDLTCRLAGERAILGGQCVTVAQGRFYLGA